MDDKVFIGWLRRTVNREIETLERCIARHKDSLRGHEASAQALHDKIRSDEELLKELKASTNVVDAWMDKGIR